MLLSRPRMGEISCQDILARSSRMDARPNDLAFFNSFLGDRQIVGPGTQSVALDTLAQVASDSLQFAISTLQNDPSQVVRQRLAKIGITNDE